MVAVTRNRDNNNKKKRVGAGFFLRTHVHYSAHVRDERKTSESGLLSRSTEKCVQKKAEAAREGAATAQFLCGEWVVFPLLL